MVDRRRQWRAENQSINIDRQISDNEFIINGSEGDEYYVNINVPVCDCPDWKKREPNGGCKHIIKAKLKKDHISTLPDEKTNHGQYTNKSEYPGDWQRLSNQTKKRDNWTCQKCGSKGGKYGDAELHAHHIVPKSKGGADKSSNLITLCRECHENQHGHSIGFGGTQSNNTSTLHTPSKDKTKQPSTSDFDVNSESGSIDVANKRDDSEEQYYDVEPGLHPDSGQSWAIKDSPPPGQNIEAPHGELERDLQENSRSQTNSKSQSNSEARSSTGKSNDGNQVEADINGKKARDKNEASALRGLIILIIVFVLIYTSLNLFIDLTAELSAILALAGCWFLLRLS